MDTRKQTPDILGDLLGGTSTPEHQHTSMPVHHNASTGKAEKKTPSRARAAGTTSKAEKGSQKRSTAPKQAETSSGVKVTFYVSEAAVEALEQAWQKLRISAPASRRTRISKSAIVQEAVLDLVQELEEKGSRSRLARAFSE